MKSMQPPSAAIFFMTYFHRAGGGHGPLGPPWIRYWLSQPIFLHIDSSISVFYQIFLGLSLVFICWFIFTDVKEGNVFRSVCHSVPLPVPGGRHPLWRQIPSPASRHPPKGTWNQTGSGIIHLPGHNMEPDRK